MSINFKEGFKRITLALCMLITLCGIALYCFDISHSINHEMSKNISFQDIKDKKIYSFHATVPNSEIIITDFIKGNGYFNVAVPIQLIEIEGKFEIMSDLKSKEGYMLIWDVPTPIKSYNNTSLDISLKDFANKNKFRVLHNNWYEYIPFVLGKFLLYTLIIVLLNGLIYSCFLMICWIISGFIKK